MENFAGVINVLLFPLLFVSGALYPTSGLPPALRWIARVNPVTYMVELVRQRWASRPSYRVTGNLLALAAFAVVAFLLASLLFDPEQRFWSDGRRALAARPDARVRRRATGDRSRVAGRPSVRERSAAPPATAPGCGWHRRPARSPHRDVMVIAHGTAHRIPGGDATIVEGRVYVGVSVSPAGGETVPSRMIWTR